ncbi:MAG: stage V sporulation protein AA [Firmicutes bacterium]|nr:stage V sporulation protein AA [Bacillota bacterium]
MDIYIKPKKKVTLYERTEVLIQDVADVVATKEVAGKIKKMRLLTIDNSAGKKQNHLISVTDIITVIQKTYPNFTVNNVGEPDTWVQYMTKKSYDRAWLKWLKIAAVVLVLFIGSSTAIMSFHTDGQVPKVFEKYYSIFFGEEKQNPGIINIPYSIGLGLGIIVFYNHFMGKKLTGDPTPIEVEMEQYDREVTETMVDALAQRQERMEKDNGNS